VLIDVVFVSSRFGCAERCGPPLIFAAHDQASDCHSYDSEAEDQAGILSVGEAW